MLKTLKGDLEQLARLKTRKERPKHKSGQPRLSHNQLGHEPKYCKKVKLPTYLRSWSKGQSKS